jgi:hypothetical protein
MRHHLEPLFVVAVGREVVAVSLHGESGLDEDIRKAVTEIAIREEGVAQAARS